MLDLELIGAPAFALEVVGQAFCYVGMNKRLQTLTGLRIEELLGRTPFDCFPEATAEAIVGRYAQCVASREALEYEEHYDLPGGSRWWSVTVTPVTDRDTQRVTMLLGIAVDVTRRRRAEIDHDEANARLSLAMDVIDGGFWHMDVASGEFRTSRPLAALIAGERAPALGLSEYLSYVEADDLPAADLSALLSGFRDESVAEYRVRTFAGETRWMRCKRRLIRDGAHQPVRIVGVAIDITEQKALQVRYKHEATTDLLTGLANRRCLEVQAHGWVQDSRASGRSLGLILLDLDQFKPVNDRFGHAAGDAVLREVAARLTNTMREQDLIARFGGDEFAILLADVEGEMLPRLSRSIARAINAPFAVGGSTVRIGVSIGTARLESADTSIDDVALRADRALYAMKHRDHARRAGDNAMARTSAWFRRAAAPAA